MVFSITTVFQRYHSLCPVLVLVNSSSENSSRYTPGVFVTAVTRVLVRQWPLESDSRVELLVFNEEVIEVEGKKVK